VEGPLFLSRTIEAKFWILYFGASSGIDTIIEYDEEEIKKREYRKMNTAAESNDFTVTQLREKLRVLRLNSKGNKEFISRLIKVDSQDASEA